MKFLQAVFLLVLSIILFPCCKKEVNKSSYVQALSGIFDIQKVNSLQNVPAGGSDSVDLYSNIGLFLDVNIALTVLSGDIVLYQGSAKVPGKIKITDRGMRFIPNEELTPLTAYSVEARIVLEVRRDDSRLVSINGKTAPVYKNELIYQVRSWKFTTRGSYKYVMGRTSRWVTDFNRDGNKIVQMGDYLYCYGGWTAEHLQSYNDIYRSSGDLTQWEKLQDAPWESRHTYGIGNMDSTLFIFGGDVFSTVFDVWKSYDGVTFKPLARDLDGMLGPRILYGACVHKGKLYVLGGQSGLGMDSALTDVWRSPNGGVWERVATNLPFLGKNISGSVASFNGRIWIMGGGYYRSSDMSERYTNSIYSSADGVTWVREPDAPWKARQYGDVCVWNNRLWLVAGYNEENLSDIWYMTTNGAWHQIETPPEFEARHASGVAVYNDKLVIVCGNYHNDCWVIEKI